MPKENIQKLEEDLKELEKDTNEVPAGVDQTPTPQPSMPPPQTAPVPSVVSQTTPEAPPPPPTPTKKSNPVLWLAIGFLFLSIVGGGGYFVMNFAKRPQPTPSPTPTPTPTETPDPTASWKTYTNENIGFLLKYPSDWSLKPYDISTNYPLHGLVQLASNINSESLDGMIILSYWDNQNRLSLEEIENKYKGEAGGPDIYFPNGEMIDFLGKQAYKGENVSCAPMMCDRIAIIKETKVIEIKSLYGAVNRNKEIFDQILSTFKFIEATPSATPISSPSASPTP